MTDQDDNELDAAVDLDEYSSDEESVGSDHGGDEGGNGGQGEEEQMEKIQRKKYAPYKFSGKSYSLDIQQESKIIDDLRKWEEYYFMNSSWIFKKMCNKLSAVRELPEAQEFDLLVKILKIFEKDEYNLEMRIKDTSNEMWFITIPKLKFGPLKEGEIIRIRSVKINISSKRNVIETRPSTNIMRFTFKNSIVQEMRQKIEMETIQD